MKMRKSTWLLLVLALAAILLVAGCEPTTPTPTPPENGEEPTPPPADKECPKVVKTEVAKAYIAADEGYGFEGYGFKLTITFNEPITSGCIEDPKKWEVTVKNDDRETTELKVGSGVKILGVDLSTDNKKAYVYATVTEELSYKVEDVVYSYTVSGKVYKDVIEEEKFPITEKFEGLICSKDDAKNYATPDDDLIVDEIWSKVIGIPGVTKDDIKIVDYDLVFGPDTPGSADVVEWKLKDCVIADELGNACCDYSGKACCLEPTCATCEEGCILGSEGSCL